MSNTKFTPGPWRVVGKIKGHNLAMWIFSKDTSPGSDRELQVFSLLDSHVDKHHLIRREADMKLIAAAPEMYELLFRIRKELNLDNNEDLAASINTVLNRINQ